MEVEATEDFWGRCLPVELLWNVWSYLRPTDLVFVEMVCSSWQGSTDHPYIWQTVHERFLGGTKNETKSWRDYVVDELKELHSFLGREMADYHKILLVVHWAAAHGHDKVVLHFINTLSTEDKEEMLLHCVYRQTPSFIRHYAPGATPLPPIVTACIHNQVNVLRLLVRHEASLESHPVIQDGPFAAALKAGSLECIKFLVEEAKVDLFKSTVTGGRPMSLAIASGRIDIVAYLLEKGLYPYPLREALSSGKEDIALLLLQHGAELSNTDFSSAVRMNLAKVVFAMIKLDRRLMAECSRELIMAAAAGSRDVVRFFIENRLADVSTCNSLGITPVYAAAFRGHLSVVRYLVEEANADAAYYNPHFRSTVLLAAVRHRQAHVVAYLLTKEEVAVTDVSSRDDDGSTVLHTAVDTGDVAMVRVLLELRGEELIDEERSDGATAWELAMVGENAEVARLIAEWREMHQKLTY